MEVWIGVLLAGAVIVTAIWLVGRQARGSKRSEVELPDEVPDFSSARSSPTPKSSKGIHDDRHEGDGAGSGDGGGGDGGGGGGGGD